MLRNHWVIAFEKIQVRHVFAKFAVSSIKHQRVSFLNSILLATIPYTVRIKHQDMLFEKKVTLNFCATNIMDQSESCL